MNITQEFGSATYRITSYDSNSVSINNVAYSCNVVISPNSLVHPWLPNHLHDLKEEHLAQILSLQPEIVIFGTRNTISFPPIHIKQYFTDKSIGIEAMDFQAACRTYNVLMAEGRKIVAVLWFTKP